MGMMSAGVAGRKSVYCFQTHRGNRCNCSAMIENCEDQMAESTREITVKRPKPKAGAEGAAAPKKQTAKPEPVTALTTSPPETAPKPRFGFFRSLGGPKAPAKFAGALLLWHVALSDPGAGCRVCPNLYLSACAGARTASAVLLADSGQCDHLSAGVDACPDTHFVQPL